MFQAVRGTSDLLPAQLTAFRQVEQKALQLGEKYGFQEIRTPLFEKADLFVRGLGVMASIVERELWTFQDKHGQKLALRADMTPCVVRAYQQHRLGKDGPTKLSYVGPVFLLGKEGGEPSRQAHQFGVEALGNDSPAVDAELLVMALEFCENVGLTGVKLEINALGCDKCRPAYHDALREFFASRQNELCDTCKRRYRNHPTWVLSCGETGCQSLANLAPTILGYLCQDCKAHFNSLKHLLQELELEVTFNPRVVRDLEYYNSTIFRLSVNGRTVGTGGRYDGLVQHLGGTDTPAAGFAIYLDEVVSLLTPAEIIAEELDFVFLPEGPESVKALLPIALKLRKAGARVEVVYQNHSDAPDCRWQVRLTEINALRGLVEIVDQDSRQQENCGADRLLARLQHLLGQGQRDHDGDGRGPRRRLNRLRKERDPRRTLEEVRPAPVSPDPEERESSEDGRSLDEAGHRRKRRRHRRGEGDEAGAAEAAPAAVVAPAPLPEDRHDARPPRREPRRRNEFPAEEVRPEPRQERPPAPPPRQEQPVKAFIPSLMLGGVKVVPQPVVARPSTPKAEEPKAANAGNTATAGNLNWAIKTKVNGQSAIEERDTTPQGSDPPLARRRPARRR